MTDPKTYGVMAIDVTSDKLADIMKGIKIGETGYAMMLHKTGLILADPKNEKNNLKTIKDIGIAGMETILEEEKASFTTNINGAAYQVDSFQSQTTDWVIAVLIQEAELSEVSNAIRKTILMITLLVIVVIGAVTYVMSGRFIRPINLMVDGLKDIAQGEGDLTMRLETNSQDEIGEMARWFNTLVEKLQGIIKSIAGDSGQLDISSSELLKIAGEVSQGAKKCDLCN